MARGIEIVNQLRTNGRLCKHQLDHRSRVARISLHNGAKTVVLRGWLKALVGYGLSAALCQSVERFARLLKMGSNLKASGTSLVSRQSLRRIAQQELIRSLE